MKTITLNIYEINELSEDSKQVAISHFLDINTDHDWWIWTYEDSMEIGCKIDGFDLERGTIDLELIDTMENVIQKILDNHGPGCDTYEHALYYREHTDSEDEFINDLGDCYLAMLQSEYHYLISDEAIIDTIEANEYYFTEDGKPFYPTKY